MFLADGKGVGMTPMHIPVPEQPAVDVVAEPSTTPVLQELVEAQPVQESSAGVNARTNGFIGSFWFWGIVATIGLALIARIFKKK